MANSNGIVTRTAFHFHICIAIYTFVGFTSLDGIVLEVMIKCFEL